MNGPIMEWFCGVSKKADEAGFIAVYPDGTGPGGTLFTWNAGVFPGKLNPKRADDVAFIGKLLDELPYLLRVDRKRVYVAGMSNGAMMAYRLAVEMPNRFAALAPSPERWPWRTPSRRAPMPILHIHGTKDGLVPFEGTKKPADRIAFRAWRKRYGIGSRSTGATRRRKSRTCLPRGTSSTSCVKTSVAAQGKAPVVLYVIEGGGHTWPGMQRHAAFLGATTLNLSANDVMWDFFRQFKLK